MPHELPDVEDHLQALAAFLDAPDHTGPAVAPVDGRDRGVDRLVDSRADSPHPRPLLTDARRTPETRGLPSGPVWGKLARMRGSQGVRATGSAEADTVSLSVRVPSELRRRLRVYAAATGTSAQDCVQEALTAWLSKREGEQSQRAQR